MRTTPEAIDLQATFRAMLDAGDRACAMEVSSHALELRRVDGVRFAVAAFTNLSQDHLDFHPDMESYFAAKQRLFAASSTSASPVVVVDDEWGRRLAARAPRARSPSRSSGAADWQRAEPLLAASAGTRSPSARPPARRRSSCRCADASTRPTRSSRWRAGHALGLALDGMAEALARRRARARARPGRRRGPGLRAARRLRAQAGGAREGARVRARGRRPGACSSCSAPAATATARSAR